MHYHVSKNSQWTPHTQPLQFSQHPHIVFLRSILILSFDICLYLSSDLLPSSFPSRISYAFLICESCHTTRQFFLYLCSNIWRREQVTKLRSMQASHFSRYLPTRSCKIAVPWHTVRRRRLIGRPGFVLMFPVQASDGLLYDPNRQLAFVLKLIIPVLLFRDISSHLLAKCRTVSIYVLMKRKFVRAINHDIRPAAV